MGDFCPKNWGKVNSAYKGRRWESSRTVSPNDSSKELKDGRVAWDEAKKFGRHQISKGKLWGEGLFVFKLRERRKWRQRIISVATHSGKYLSCFGWQIIRQLNKWQETLLLKNRPYLEPIGISGKCQVWGGPSSVALQQGSKGWTRFDTNGNKPGCVDDMWMGKNRTCSAAWWGTLSQLLPLHCFSSRLFILA